MTLRQTWGFLLETEIKLASLAATRYFLKEDLQFPSGLSAQQWKLRWRLLSFIGFVSSIHSSTSGSSSLIFLCRNNLCFIGYILCGHQEVPCHPAWGRHGTQAGPFLNLGQNVPKTENKSSTLKKCCPLVPAV